MEIREFQERIRECYYEKDAARGRLGTFAWLVEEVGELSRDLRRGDREALAEEFADVFAWLASLASLCDIELETAVAKYAGGCPKCSASPCICSEPKSGLS
jgi:NTP pyrophosphatase (non-canonical NTP hydrolase)